MKKENNEPITFSPSKAQSYLGVGMCIVFSFILFLLSIEEIKNLPFFFFGALFFLWMITHYLVRLHNRLTINSSGLLFEGRTGPLFLRKRVELPWKDFQYCRTRSYQFGRYGSYHYQFLDFYDQYERKINTLRIDYFEDKDIEKIVQLLTSKRKFNNQKCIKHSQWFILLFYIIPSIFLLFFILGFLFKHFSRY